MKQRNKGARRMPFALLLILMLSCWACQKNPSSGLVTDNMTQVASILKGGQVNGNISIENSGQMVGINLNSGRKYFLIQKLNTDDLSSLKSIQKAEIIFSNYGLIIKDPTNNTVLLLPNNDIESRQKFDAVKPLFQEKVETKAIFGITIVNAEQA